MIAPPPLSMAQRFPLSALLCLAAATVSIGSMFGLSIEPFIINERAFWSQPWRIVLTILPHGSVMHLFFNLYWLWTLGAAIEHFFGPRLWIAIALMSAVGASSLEYAFSASPIGLSGVVYAFFTFLWVTSRRVPRMRGLVDTRTAWIFAAWFVICIILTRTGVMNIANIAHGAGAVVGGLIGLALTMTRTRGSIVAVATSCMVGASLLAAGSFQSVLNPSGVSERLLFQAHTLLLNQDYGKALPLLEEARQITPNDAAINIPLMYAAAGAGQFDRALEVLNEHISAGLAQGDARDLTVFAALAAAEQALVQRQPDLSRPFLRQASLLDPTDPEPWALLSTYFEYQGSVPSAILCIDRALELDPQRADLRDRRQQLEFLHLRAQSPRLPGP